MKNGYDRLPIDGENGFSLLEVVVASAIAITTLLAFSQLTNFMVRSQKTNSLSGDYSQLVSNIQQVLGSDTACPLALGPVDFRVGGREPGQGPIPGTGVPVNTLAVNGTKILPPPAGITLTRFTFNNVITKTGNTYIANLHLEAMKTPPGGAVGSSFFPPKDFYITLTTNGSGAIQTCSSTLMSGQAICLAIGGSWISSSCALPGVYQP